MGQQLPPWGERTRMFPSLFLGGLISLFLQGCPFIMISSFFHPEIKHSLGRKIRQIFLAGMRGELGLDGFGHSSGRLWQYGNTGILAIRTNSPRIHGGCVGRDTVGERKALKIIEFSHSIFKENVILILIVM